MNSFASPAHNPQVKIRVSGKLFQGHLAYLDQLVQSAIDCQLWPLLSLSQLEELDRAALCYLIDGENRTFGLDQCPSFIRDWMERERDRAAA
jgi:hypothetical protein